MELAVPPFATIQGEGPYAGIPMLFVRFQGCNLWPDKLCYFCDTGYAQEPRKGEGDRPVNEIIWLVEDLLDNKYPGIDTLCITGGEPLMQNSEDMEEFIGSLSERISIIEVETNGTLPMPKWHYLCEFVVDIKPDMECHESWLDPNVMSIVYYKFLLGTPAHIVEAENLITLLNIPREQCYISPIVGDGLADGDITQLCVDLCLKLGTRLNIQLHKLIGVE